MSGLLMPIYKDAPLHKGHDAHRINTLRPRQNGRRFTDDIFECIFLNENVWIPITISLKFVPKCRINTIPAMIMAWRRPGDKPLSEPMMVSLPTYICVTRPKWLKYPSRNEILSDNIRHVCDPRMSCISSKSYYILPCYISARCD